MAGKKANKKQVHPHLSGVQKAVVSFANMFEKNRRINREAQRVIKRKTPQKVRTLLYGKRGAVNDLIILVAFAPIVAFLLGVGGVSIPWDTLLLSVVLFVVIPLAAGVITRIMVIRRKGVDYFNKVFIKKFNNYTVGGLLLTLIILFSFQGETILNNPLHILLIAVPLVLQTVLIFFVAYGWAKWWKLPHDVAAPAGMIGASNFFELAVAVAISLFGLQSGAALATVVGVLVEVPVMLMLVRIANNTRKWFPITK